MFFVGKCFTLITLCNDEFTPLVPWTSSNPDIVTIDENGNVKIVSKGTTIINVMVTEYPYIKIVFILLLQIKIEQLKIGSGLSKEDPIFLENEGEDEPIEIYFIEMQYIF